MAASLTTHFSGNTSHIGVGVDFHLEVEIVLTQI